MGLRRNKDKRQPTPKQDFGPKQGFAREGIPRYDGPPASSTPLADYLGYVRPGVTDGYVTLPRSLTDVMPLSWQQQMAHLLAQFHQSYLNLNWPEYRVVPSRRERLVDLDEDQLAEVGYLVEIDAEGELVYRERSGRRVEHPERTEVLVSCLDPIPADHRNTLQDTPPNGIPAHGNQTQQGSWS